MKEFAAEWQDRKILQQLVANLPWSANNLSIGRIERKPEMEEKSN